MENIYSFCVPNDFPSVSLPNPFSDFLEYKYTLKMECTDLSRNLFAQGMMIAKSSHLKDSFEAHLSFNWQLVQVAVLLGKAKPRQRITSGGREAWKGIQDYIFPKNFLQYLKRLTKHSILSKNIEFYGNLSWKPLKENSKIWWKNHLLECLGAVCSSWGILNQDKVPLVHSRLLPFSCGITLRPSVWEGCHSEFL